MDNSAAWQQWRTQFDHLQSEVMGLIVLRLVWRDIRAMIETNKAIKRSGFAENWLTQCYSVCQLVAVRRQVDSRKDVRSLRRSLDALARKPGMATRDWFVGELAQNPYAHSLSRGFDVFAPGGQEHVDSALVEADRDRLVSRAENAKRIVDTSLAHLDPARREEPPTITWGEFDQAVDTIGELYQKYYALARPGERMSLKPVVPTGWDRMFETAWKSAAG